MIKLFLNKKSAKIFIFVFFLFIISSPNLLPKIAVAANGISPNCTEDKLKNDESLGRKICEIFKADQYVNSKISKINCQIDDYQKVLTAVLASLDSVTYIACTTPDAFGTIPCTYATQDVYAYCDNTNPDRQKILNETDLTSTPYEDILTPMISPEEACLLTDSNGKPINTDKEPCTLNPSLGLLNPFNLGIGGLINILYLIIRRVLIAILDVFQWFLIPSNFGGYINFLNFHPGPSNPSLVPQLWSFIKNFANLGIILGMIFTAIATILRIEKFNWKKMLPKLLLIALLVNFSLIIAGMFVDISNYIVNVTVTSSNNISLSNLVVNCTLCPTVKAFYVLGGGWDLVRAAGLGLILSALFFYQFVGLVFYVISRIITIVICLITSPLAFISFAFPGGEKVWDFWRKQFQQAIVILPVLCITLLLSVQFIIIIINNLNINVQGGYKGANFTIVLAYAGFVIVFAQLVRYVAKFLGVEQVEKGFQLAKKAVSTIAMVGAATVIGFGAGKMMKAGARTRINPQTGEEEVIPPFYDRLANTMTHIPIIGSKIAMNLYKLKGKVTGKEADQIKKEIDLIKENEDSLSAYFDQSINDLAKMKALVAKTQAGLAWRDNEIRWYNQRGTIIFNNTQDDRDIKKAIPVLRNQGTIAVDTVVTQRIAPTLQSREASEKMLGTTMFDYMYTQRHGEFPLFVHQILEHIGSPVQLENLLLSINAGDRNRIVGYINDAVNNDMAAYLDARNPRLWAQFQLPVEKLNDREKMARETLHYYFGI